METLQENKYTVYESKALWLRNKVLEMAVSVNSGHVSTAFSQAELLVALYNGKILNYDPKNLKWDQVQELDYYYLRNQNSQYC